MKTLKFLAAESFVRDTEKAQQSLCWLSHNLFPLLFKASYLHEQSQILHDVVQHWPLAELSLKDLLGRTADCDDDLTDRTCSAALGALLDGLKDHVLCQPVTYAKHLRLVDLTGIRDVQFQLCRCGRSLGKWARTEKVTRICYELLLAMESQDVSPSVFGVSIDIRMDVFVTSRNYEAAVQALLLRCHCPLKIRCVEFRADSLPLKNLFYIIKLAVPASLQKLSIVHNIRMEMPYLEVLLSRVSFPNLRALTLPARTFDVRRYGPEDIEMLAKIGEMLSQLTCLRELSIPFSPLSGQIRKLLSPLDTPLQVLEVANCSLSHTDMVYLANSVHAEHLERLDLSGHDVADLYPAMFFKLLSRASLTLKSLTLEECNIGEEHINLMIVALVPCRKLTEFRFLGNPFSFRALKCLFNAFVDFPHLKYVEFPVPRDCYSDNVTYPLDDATLGSYDKDQYERMREELMKILYEANREDILASTPLFGSYDPDIQETSNELGVFMLQSFKDALSNFMESLKT
ncbi:leucine-rich repeat-containing protein 14B [Polypterus senegalus]